MSRLTKEEIVVLKALKEKNQGKMSKSALAQLLHVSEGAVRYHLKREKEDISDRRKNKPMKADAFAHIIEERMKISKSDNPPSSIEELYDELISEYGYQGSYRSVLRYVRKHYPSPLIRPRRRVELPAGCAAQVDWAENVWLMIGGVLKQVHALVLTFSYSRATAVIWSFTKDEQAWIYCHNRAFQFLGGIPAVVRPDNLKTAVVKGQGSGGTLNKIYQGYARDIGFHINPARVRTATDKGKVEAKVKLVRKRLTFQGIELRNIEELQAFSDEVLTKEMKRLISPATGKSIYETLSYEREALRPCPKKMPEPFDITVVRKVNPNCLIRFENHFYSCPFQYTGDYVEIRGYVGKVNIFKNGECIAVHPRRTERLLVIDQSHYEGKATDKLATPTPLGKVTSLLLDCFDIPVEKRAIRVYEKVAEVMG